MSPPVAITLTEETNAKKKTEVYCKLISSEESFATEMVKISVVTLEKDQCSPLKTGRISIHTTFNL